jgi:hypothetical protein
MSNPIAPHPRRASRRENRGRGGEAAQRHNLVAAGPDRSVATLPPGRGMAIPPGAPADERHGAAVSHRRARRVHPHQSCRPGVRIATTSW